MHLMKHMICGLITGTTVLEMPSGDVGFLE